MKTKSILIFLLTVSFCSFGQLLQEEFEQSIQEAKGYYDENKFDEAESVLLQLKENGVVNSELFYNLGNVYFRKNEQAKSVFYYEKALLLNPSNEDARYNLTIMNQQLKDEFDVVPRFDTATILNGLNQVISFQTLFFAGLLIMIGLGVLVFLKKRKSTNAKLKKQWVVFGVAVFILLLSFAQYQVVRKGLKHGIVMNDRVVITSAPASNSTVLYTVNEGVKVEVLQIQDNWKRVRLPNGSIGWIANEELWSL